MDINKLSNRIIGSAIEVHKTLGPGLLESAYDLSQTIGKKSWANTQFQYAYYEGWHCSGCK